MGVPWNDCPFIGQILGERIVLNEFVGYLDLSDFVKTHPGAIDPRSVTLASYALCGFANFSSIAIQIGGIGALAPERRPDLARLVTDASGSPVVGAEISAVDTSSGTKYSTVSRAGGRWDIANVKTGGPFRITASANGQTKTRSGIYTTLQQVTDVNLQLGGGP